MKNLISHLSFLLGFLLIFGWTSLAPFEILIIFSVISTGIFILIKNISLTHLYSPRNYVLFSFAILMLLQSIFGWHINEIFLLTSIYLVTVYFLVQFWYARDKIILKYLMRGYLTGIVISSIIGFVTYFVAVVFGVFSDKFFWKDSVRISVFFSDPVVYGAFLIPALIFLSFKAFTAENLKRYILCLLIVLILFSNLIFTGSRGAWLNLAIVGMMFFIFYRPIRKKVFLLPILGVISSTLILAILLIFIIPIDSQSYFNQTLKHRAEGSDAPRIENLQRLPEQIVNRSITMVVFGSGSGSYEGVTDEVFSAHNSYVRILYEQGVVGLVLYLIFWVFLFRVAWLKRKTNLLLATFLLAILSGIFVHGFFIDTLHWRHFWVIAAITF